VVVVLLTPSEEWGIDEVHGDLTVEPRPKVWTRCPKWNTFCQRRTIEARMRDNPEGGEVDPVEGVCRYYKKNVSVLFCLVLGGQ